MKPPKRWFPKAERAAVRPGVVGNGADYTLVSLPYVTLAAIGSFDYLNDVKTVKSIGIASFGGKGISGPNVYSLQLNSNNFSTTACGAVKNCLGWTQFVYTNQPVAYGGGGNLIIQDWLVPVASGPLSGCPPGAGWEKSSGSCVQNAPISVRVPEVPVTELRQVSLSGSASASGDSAFLAVGSIVYGMQNMQGDGITDLSKHWTGSEFNIVGNGGGSRAIFNKGSTITVRVEADTGEPSAPQCQGNSGTTGESNNLSFVAAPSNPGKRRYPSILFTESNAGSGGTASCAALSANGS